jgi:hypothetical protein
LYMLVARAIACTAASSGRCDDFNPTSSPDSSLLGRHSRRKPAVRREPDLHKAPARRPAGDGRSNHHDAGGRLDHRPVSTTTCAPASVGAAEMPMMVAAVISTLCPTRFGCPKFALSHPKNTN